MLPSSKPLPLAPAPGVSGGGEPLDRLALVASASDATATPRAMECVGAASGSVNRDEALDSDAPKLGRPLPPNLAFVVDMVRALKLLSSDSKEQSVSTEASLVLRKLEPSACCRARSAVFLCSDIAISSSES